MALQGLAGAATLVVGMAQAQTVTAVMHSGLRLMDPIRSTAFITREHGYMIYDTLVGMDAGFNVRPQMADWEVRDDGKVYRFALRDGLTWHDGTPVTAQDCVASIERWLSYDSSGSVLKGLLSGIEIVDDGIFDVKLNESSQLFLDSLAKISSRPAFMMPKRVIDAAADGAITEMIGSGPFRFVDAEFKPGVKVVYEKNTDYVPRQEPNEWTSGAKQVNVDRIEWIAMPDAMTGVNALQNGEIDYIEHYPVDLLALVQNDKDIILKSTDPLGNWNYARFNHKHPPFDNKMMRQAAMYAIGQEDVLKALIGNSEYYRTCASPYGCGTPNATDSHQDMVVSANPEKAAALLKEAGYDGTPVVVLQPTDNDMASPQPVVIAAALRKAGFVVDLQAMDWQSLVTRRSSTKAPSDGGWSIFSTYGIVAAAIDPFANTTLASNGDGAWFGWPDVPEIEALRLEYARADSSEKKREIAAAIQDLALEEGVIMPMGQFQSPTAYSSKLDNIPEAPITAFWGVTKE